MTPAEIERKNL